MTTSLDRKARNGGPEGPPSAPSPIPAALHVLSGTVDQSQVVASPADMALVERLRSGDETAFITLVERHQATMMRIAQMHVSSRAVAEEVVQEAWLGVIKGIDRFEGRASLRTWVFRILTNIAKARGQAEGRTVPYSMLADDEDDGIDPNWFQDANGRSTGGWRTFPDDWRTIPEDRLLGKETLDRIAKAIASLPSLQAEVIRLRDVLGWSSEEVVTALGISETYQRVLLHRARSRVRRELDQYLSSGSEEA